MNTGQLAMKVIYRFFLFVVSYNLSAQTIISGILLDEQKKPVPNVSVSYKKIGSQAILGFGRTTEEGIFKLNIKPVDTDSLSLVFNHMSYARKTINVPLKTADYTFTLEVEAREFETITVKQRPITMHNDTINYNVNAFTSQQDRVIADIIKKLPGVEVVGNEILYQGKPIQKYMVNNLDLMEGRYGIINNNLPADAVRSVQIIENNQPIKILDSLVFSDRASLNLELKKFTSTGTGKAGVGTSPALWLANLTPMTFGKSFQMLNSFQTNNIGLDVSRDLRAFYTGGNYFGSGTNAGAAPSYISVRGVSTPGFDQRRWLDNKIFLASTNLLQKLKNGMEIKGNASYYDDTQNRRGVTSTQYFTSQELILNTEEINNRHRTNALDVGLLLEKNEKSVYLKNTLKFNKRWNTDLGQLLFNSQTPIEQRRSFTDMTLFNHFSAARFIGKQLVNINSNLEYHHTPQRLWVSPGQFEAVLNQNEPFDAMQQNVLFKGFSWNNGLSFTRRLRGFRLNPALALKYQSNRLDSFIETDKKRLEGGLYTNHTTNGLLETALRLGFMWENNFWKISGQIPFSINNYRIGIAEQKNLTRTTFKPGANVTYLLNSKNEISWNGSAGNSFGGLNNFYDAYIISQYRNMQRYEARLLGTDDLGTGLYYRFKNTLKAQFANLSYNYSQSSRDYIFNTQLDSLGRNTTQINDQISRSSSHRISGGASVFLNKSKTVVRLSASTSRTQADYLLNNVMGKQHSNSYNTTLEFINNYFSKLSADYNTSFGQTNNRLQGNRTNKLIFINHFLNLVYSPTTNQSVSVSNSYYRNNIPSQKKQYFLDATYRYTFRKWKTDLEFTAYNLLNNSSYVQQFSSTYELVQSRFDLRPRQFFVSTMFRF